MLQMAFLKKCILISILFCLHSLLHAEVAIIEVINTTSLGNDGKIVLLASGDAGPFIVDVYKDGVLLPAKSRTGVNGLFMVDDLMPGNYSVWVIDRFGCETRMDIEIIMDVCSLSVEVIDIAHPTFCNFCNVIPNANPCSSDGGIAIQVRSENTDYTITWRDRQGNEYPSDALALNNAQAGFYIITATSTSDPSCKATATAELIPCSEIPADCGLGGDPETDQVIITGFDVLGASTPAASDGAIVASVDGLSDRYEVYWTDGETGEILGNGINLVGVGIGEYCLNIENSCTQSSIQECIEITCVMRHKVLTNIDYTGDCENGPTLSIDLENVDNSLFNYTWDAGSTGTSISTPEFREYCMTITDPNSDCVQEFCFTPEVPGFRITEIEGVCPDAIDGSVSFEISNPLDEPIEIKIDDIPYSAQIGNIPNLREGAHELEVIIGDCTYEETFSIGRAETERIYLDNREDLDGHLLCVYGLSCKGRVLEGFEFEEDAEFDLKEASSTGFTVQNVAGQVINFLTSPLDIIGLGFVTDFFSGIFGGGASCKAPAKCGDESLGNKDFGSETTRLYEYDLLVRNDPILRNDPVTRGFLLRGIEQKLLDNPCQRVTFCKRTYSIQGYNGGFSSVGAGGEPFRVGGNCFKHYCGDPFGKVTCVEEVLERYGIRFETNTTCVNRVTELVADLIYSFERGFTYEGDVKTFIEANKDKREANCATITYCPDNWEVLYTDIDEIECTGGICSMTKESTDPNMRDAYICDLIVIFCPGEGEKIFRILEYSKYDRHAGGGGFREKNPIKADIISNVVIEEKRLGRMEGGDQFLKLISEDRSLSEENVPFIKPNYLFEEGDAVVMVNYSHRAYEDKLLIAPNFELMIIDQIEKWASLINRQDEQSVDLMINYNNSLIEKTIGASEELFVNHFYKKGTSVFLTIGTQADVLDYSGTSIDKNDSQFVVLQLDITGLVQSTYLLDNLDSPVFSGETQRTAIAGTTALGDSIVAVVMEDSGLWQSKLSVSSGLSVAAVSASTAGDKVAMIVTGTGLIASQSWNEQLNNEILILQMDKAGNVLGSLKMLNSNIDLTKVPLSYTDDNELVGIINYTDAITFNGQSYTSEGSTDFLIFKLDSSGSVLNIWEEGTSTYENAHKIMCSNDIIYFGGEIRSLAASVTLGNTKFDNHLASDYTRPYMSYVLEDDFIPYQ